jgi:hypothetical protein
LVAVGIEDRAGFAAPSGNAHFNEYLLDTLAAQPVWGAALSHRGARFVLAGHLAVALLEFAHSH